MLTFICEHHDLRREPFLFKTREKCEQGEQFKHLNIFPLIYTKILFSECRDRKRPSKDSSYEGLMDRAGKAGEEGGEGEGEEEQVQF